MARTGFKSRRKVETRDLVPMSDVLRFCRGAAALAMPGKQWSAEDRADVAAELAAGVWAEAVALRANTAAEEVAPSSLRGPAPKMSRGKLAKTTARVRVTVDAVPAELVKGATLYSRAGTLARSRQLERARLMREGAEHARSHGFRTGNLGAFPDGIPASPAAAHEHARQVLSDLGVARLGKLYPATYAACREAAGMTALEVAAELRMNAGTLKARKSTAATFLPSAAVFSAQAHADALRVDYWAPPLRTKDASLPESLGKRMRPGHKYPNVKGATVPTGPVAAKRLAAGRRKYRPGAAAQWTADLSAPLRAKLATAARNQRERAAAKPAEQRAADRLRAGIPAVRGTARIAPRDLLSPVPSASYGKAPEWHPPLRAERAWRRLTGPNVGGAKRTVPFILPAVVQRARRNGPGVPKMAPRKPGACRCETGRCKVHRWRQPMPHTPVVWQAPRTAASRKLARELAAAERAQDAKRATPAKRPAGKRATRPIPQAPRKAPQAARYPASAPYPASWQGQRVVRRPEQAPQASAYQRACRAQRRDLAQWAREVRAAKLAAEAAEREAAERMAWEARA